MADIPTPPSTPGMGIDAQTRLVERLLANIQTATPVKVVAVTPGGTAGSGTVDVLPLVNQVDEARNPVPHGVVHGLPYHRHAAGGAAIIIDPLPGDLGLAVFASRDVSAVKASRGQANPGSFRRHSMADGFYFGGVMTGAATHYVQISSQGVVVETTATISLNAPTIALTGDALTHNGVNIGATHKHKGVQQGSAITDVPE